MKIKNLKFKILKFSLYPIPYTLNPRGGQAAIISVLFFVAVTLILSVNNSENALKEESSARSQISGKKGYFLSEAGQEDVIYRILTGKPLSQNVLLSLDGATSTTTVTDVGSDKEISTTGNSGQNTRKTKIALELDTPSFVYGAQIGAGGLHMENNSLVIGNVFSNGPITGQNNNRIQGTVTSAGLNGSIDGIYATSSAYAHTISDSYIEGNVYYQTISDTTVLGQLFSNSTDQATVPLPITDEVIADWETAAQVEQVINSPCPYEIEDNITLGPVKINCDVEISGSGTTLTVTGDMWIVGDLTVTNSSKIQIDSSLGNKSVVVIADDPTDRTSGSKIEFQDTSQFLGSGTAGSYLLFISQNNSAELGGSVKAIEVKNSARGDMILYAGHGKVELSNNAIVKEVSAYQLRLKNSISIQYNSLLQNLIFFQNPISEYEISSWKEVE